MHVENPDILEPLLENILNIFDGMQIVFLSSQLIPDPPIP
jgi:hypothetical protein